MENPTRTTHPMVIVAAVAVTLASLVAIASFAGWLPSKSSNEAAQAPVAATTVAQAAPETTASPKENKPIDHPQAASAKKPPAKKSAKDLDHTYESTTGHSTRSTTPVNDSGIYVENSHQQTQHAYAASCRDCGTVEGIREVKHEGEGTGLGAIGGGVLGGLLGNQIGGGKGKTVGAVVGAVGGAYAGNAVEKNIRSTKSYEITVRLDDGNTRVISEPQPPTLQRGDRVRLHNGQLSRLY